MGNVHANFQASTFKTDKPLDRSILWSDFIKFSLNKVEQCIKSTFFGLKLSWNDFKVIYPWIEVKKKNPWGNSNVHGGQVKIIHLVFKEFLSQYEHYIHV